MDVDPYLPPAQDPSPEGALVEHGRLWRVEDGKVLVQDGAVLPDVCILGGSAGAPGNRIIIELNPLRSWRLPEKKIQISVFQALDRARRLGWRSFVLTSLPALLALGIFLLRPRIDLLKEPWGMMIVAILGVAVALRVATKDLKLASRGDGWYELKNLSPRVLDQLFLVFYEQAAAPALNQQGHGRRQSGG